MKILVIACLAGMLLSAPPAFAITIGAQVEGPLLSEQRVIEIVGQNLQGEIANVEDLEQGGIYRLYARVASKHIGPGSWFLYLAEIQLQRQVVDAETRRRYWASIRSAVLWGTVPSEAEVRDALESLLDEKVSQWQTD
ncbi:MAG: hypothetical protein JSU95_12835 [Betaproteobacteria bacterium]|nr:MAG: hypothetical protein JSU95_12835 [Betaproteobacteria bacterium]